MAVETPHMNLLPSSQLLSNREMIKLNNNHFYNAQIDGSVPLSSSLPLLPFHQSTFCDPNSMNKSDSGLTCHNIPVPRKRPRGSIAESNALSVPPQNNTNLSSQPPFLEQNLLYHLHTQQSEIDRFIAQHTEKMKMELGEQRMRQSRMLVSAIQQAVAKKLKQKDEEIQRMAKVNWVLQEKVKSLNVENQIWRELAQTNEAAANSLRSDLEQVLAHVNDDHRGDTVAEEDAESSCASNHHGEEENDAAATVGNLCRECGVRESIILLLPCRHLCLCTTCGSTIRNCPLCHSPINASVHVNFS